MSVFDELTNEYDAWFVENSNLYDTEVGAVKSMLDEDKKYIEVGVGTGLFATRLGITEGVEPSTEMAKYATFRGIKVHSGIAEHLPYEDNSIDGIVMITVDCFVKDINPVFREAYRVLKKNGSYVMAFLDRESPLGGEYEKSKATNEFYKDATFRSAREMKAYLKEAGLKVIDTINTVFTLDNTNQPIHKGNGDGVFAIIKAVKEI